MNEIVSSLIADNIKAEGEAIKDYFPLISELEKAGDKEGADMVREIVSDEKNHLNLLQGILMKHDGGIKITADGLVDVLDFLKANVRKD